MFAPTVESGRRDPWNKGKLVGQKYRRSNSRTFGQFGLELGHRKRGAIDSKLRGCDLVQLRVRDVAHGDRIAARTIVMQQKTQRPVQFEITEPTRKSVFAWIRHAGTENRRLSVSEPDTIVPTSVDPAIRENRRGVGYRNRPGRGAYGTLKRSQNP